MSKLKKVAIVLLSIPGALLMTGGLLIRTFVSNYDSTLIQTIKMYSEMLYGSSKEIDILLIILELDKYVPWIVITGIVWLIISAYAWNRSVSKNEKD